MIGSVISKKPKTNFVIPNRAEGSVRNLLLFVQRQRNRYAGPIESLRHIPA
jgi:hypothetical protein